MVCTLRTSRRLARPDMKRAPTIHYVTLVLAAVTLILAGCGEVRHGEASHLVWAQDGRLCSGPPATPAALAGRVVLVDYWSVDCPPCLAAIPALCAVQGRHRDRLRVIATQWGNASADAAAGIWRQHGGGTSVSVLDYAALRGVDVDQLPWAVVFDAAGQRRGEGDSQAMIALAERLLAADQAPSAGP